MNKAFVLILVGIFMAQAFAYAASEEDKTKEGDKVKTEQKADSVHDFTVKDIDGKEVKLEEYQGKVLLIVNTASKCGFTPQYEGLQKLHEKYSGQGFSVLGFPANNFMGQEPGTNAEIKEFCSTKFNVTFPMFEKISVKGDDQHPLYRYLTAKETNPESAGDITWNFNKFLIGKDGKILARFDSKVKPEDEQLTSAIERALKAETKSAD